jgi:predicted nucleotidyltransferase
MLEPIAARHEAVIARLTQAAANDERIAAAWLQGSRADGSADDFSDIDLYVALQDDAYAAFDKLAFIEQAARVLVHAEPPFMPGLVNCLLEGPAKLDFVAEPLAGVGERERPAVQMLVDKADVASRLKTGWQPDGQAIARQVDELLRVTFQGATWPVRLLRRGHWLTHAFSELVLIHSTIMPLLLVLHDRRAFFRNPMGRERLLTDGERRELDDLAQETLRALADRSLVAAYDAHVRILDVLSCAGRAVCAGYGLSYPDSAEQEARAFYAREWPREA